MKSLILSLLLFSSIFAKDYLYFLPQDSEKLEKHIINLIKQSKNSIDISMYNFSYKKLAKELKKARKDGVKIDVIFDNKKVQEDKNSQYHYLKKHNINTFIADKKLHTKVAIFDKNTIVFGSMNWSEKSFSESYEIVYITDDKKIIDKTSDFLETLKR